MGGGGGVGKQAKIAQLIANFCLKDGTGMDLAGEFSPDGCRNGNGETLTVLLI